MKSYFNLYNSSICSTLVLVILSLYDISFYYIHWILDHQLFCPFGDTQVVYVIFLIWITLIKCWWTAYLALKPDRTVLNGKWRWLHVRNGGRVGRLLYLGILHLSYVTKVECFWPIYLFLSLLELHNFFFNILRTRLYNINFLTCLIS